MATTPLPIPELKLETVRIPEEILVRCTGRITSITADTLKTTIRRLIPESKRVVLDLTDVNYMDSSGLGALVEVFRLAKRQQGEMRIINLNQRLAELFRSTMWLQYSRDLSLQNDPEPKTEGHMRFPFLTAPEQTTASWRPGR